LRNQSPLKSSESLKASRRPNFNQANLLGVQIMIVLRYVWT